MATAVTAPQETTAAQQELAALALDSERQVGRLQLNLHRVYLAQAAHRIQAQFPNVATFQITRDDHDGDDIVISEAADADGEPLGEEVDDAIRTDIFDGFEADDFASVLGQEHTVAEAAAYRPDREAEVSMEDLGLSEEGEQEEGKVYFEFTIHERTNYTGSVGVDRKALREWMQERGLTDLSGDDLQEFTSDRGIDHEEKHGDVQGQEWSDLTVD